MIISAFEEPAASVFRVEKSSTLKTEAVHDNTSQKTNLKVFYYFTLTV
jgi:hypothetical protein